MMKFKGALAAAVLLGGGVALAEQPQDAPLPMGDATQAGEAAQETELTGTVIRAENEVLYVRNAQGESVQLKVDEDTRFDDPTITKLDDLQAGQEVRASYSVEGEDNVASTIALKEKSDDKALGGSGDEGIDSGMREKDHAPPPPVTPEPGTGGSGDLENGALEPMPEDGLDTGGSGLDQPDPQPHPGDVQEPVDMQQ